MVRTEGFEPSHLLALPPQDSVSTVPPRPRSVVCRHKAYELLLTDEWVRVKCN